MGMSDHLLMLLLGSLIKESYLILYNCVFSELILQPRYLIFIVHLKFLKSSGMLQDPLLICINSVFSMFIL